MVRVSTCAAVLLVKVEGAAVDTLSFLELLLLLAAEQLLHTILQVERIAVAADV